MSNPARAAAWLSLALLVGCSGGGVPQPGALPAVPPNAAPSLPLGNYIKHVVIVVQENRTFDNVYSGYPKADSATSGLMHTGQRIALSAITFQGNDIIHSWSSGLTDYDRGKMDGFDLPTTLGRPSGRYPYAHLERSLVAPYWSIAKQYTLADHMFTTEFGDSFVAHLDLVAGTANVAATLAEIDHPSGVPWGCNAPAGTVTSLVNSNRTVLMNGGPFPCFSQFRTMADTLDAAHVSWRYYEAQVDPWSAFDAIKNVRQGSDWKNVIAPETTVLTDAAHGTLPAVSWVTPSHKNSDHPGADSDTGPSWVASVVNAIGKSSDWQSTAIVVVWDDWGGWYDHVPPPQLDFRGLGIRVPCLIVSPYAKRGYVSHTRYEFGSILKFVEQTFKVPTLASLGSGSGYTDGRANSLVDSFDFTQTPRAFSPIPAKYPRSYFLSQPPSLKVPDNE